MSDDQKKKRSLQEDEKEDPTEDVSDDEVQVLDELGQQLQQLQDELQKARQSEIRAMADYQNLVRRTQEERVKMMKFASLSVVGGLLQPLDHLFLAKEQLKDQGLNMVYQQFVTALQNEGLEEVDVMGKEFDPETMEVVNKEAVEDGKQDGKVVKVAQRGYRLNGDVIRHAKVVVGEATK